MSLGAKELFHTNFLAFLLEIQSDDLALVAIQKDLKKLLFGHNEIGRVITWREKYSLDLVIMPAPVTVNNGQGVGLDGIGQNHNGTTIAVVIEVKLKSIPTQQQLNEYDLKLKSGIIFELDVNDQVPVQVSVVIENEEKYVDYKFMKLKLKEVGCNQGSDGENTKYTECTIVGLSENKKSGYINEFQGTARRILLWPGNKTFSKDMGCWNSIIWKDVVSCLDAGTGKWNETKLLQSIVCDYRNSLDNLLIILKNINEYIENDFSSSTYGSYYRSITHENFKAIRIHDLVGKYSNYNLEQKIVNFISSKLSIDEDQPTEFKIGQYIFTFNSYTFYSNQQPGVTFEWLCKQEKLEVSFGVAIQGVDYRHFISVAGNEGVERNLVLERLVNVLSTINKNWFLPALPKLDKDFVMKKGKGKDKEKTLYVFTKSKFRYSKSDITDFRLDVLSEAVLCSLTSARCMFVLENPDLSKELNSFFNQNTPLSLLI
jgi:hypothetical protein